MRNLPALALLLLALSAGPAPAEEALGEEWPVEPVKCVHIGRIDNTDIIDDRTIVFYMRGRDIYLNRLPHRCPGLRVADAFGYTTSLTVLCNVDIIRVLRSFDRGFQSGVGCGLGLFEPITKEEIALLKDKTIAPDDEAVAAEIETSINASEADTE